MRLSYREYGSGRPLVILHGLFGCADNWHTLARRMEGKRRLIAADLRNHGRSPHSDEFTFPAMAADVQELLDELDLGRADILGHSLGGKVAMELALEHPERVERLIVVDIAPKRYAPHHVELKDAMLALDLSRVSSRREAERELAKRVENRSVRLFLLKNLTVGEDGSYRWQLNLEGINRSFHETGAPIAEGRRFDGPTLFLRGGRSGYIELPEDEALIHRLFPQAEMNTIDGATHWVHAERPDAVIEAIEGFLSP